MNSNYIINEIVNILNKYNTVKKVVLFGSRSRGDNTEKSDKELS